MGRAGERRAGIGLALVALVALALAGCAKSAEASSLPTPAVAWEAGEPTGLEWDSEWATAYRDAEVQWSAARVYGDFSDPKLVAALGYEEAVAKATTAVDTRFDPASDEYRISEVRGTYAFWGSIVDVEVAPDGESATVYGCGAGIGIDKKLEPQPVAANITRQADGNYNIDYGYDGKHPKNCFESTIWVAKWATSIDIDNVGRDSVKMPLPRDYYVKLGVISE